MKQMSARLALVVLAVAMVPAAGHSAAVPDAVYQSYARKDFAAAEKLLRDALAAARDDNARFALEVELGDLYLDKLRDWNRAEAAYSAVVTQYPSARLIADVIYRLGLAQERNEKYLDAAQNYEQVAIRYQGSTFAEDALNAIERCFRKNYQDRAAYVDSFPITRLEFDDMVSRSPAAYEKFEDKLKLVNSMIDDRLLYADARNKGLERDEEFLRQMADYRRDQMMQTWYDRDVVKKVVIPDSAKRNYFAAHRNDYITPEQVRAREIHVKSPEEADSLYRMLTVDKLPIDSLAKARSVAPSKDQGGNMGFFRRNARTREIDSAAFGMKVDEVSRPFKSGDNYVILKVEEKRERKEKTYSDVASELENRLKPQRTQDRLQKMLDSLKQGHVVQDSLALEQNRDTLATVDGMPILAADLNAMMERVPPMYRAQFENPEGKKRILDQLLTEKLVMGVTERSKYWLANDVVGQALDRERQLLTQMLKKREVTDKVTVSDKAIQDDYKKTIKDFKVPEQVRAKEIISRTQDEARAIRQKLVDKQNPISFDSLARTVSVAPSRWAAGDMGLLTRGQKPKPVEKALFSLKPKAISKVIKVNDTTYTIIRVDEHRKAYTRPLDEVRPKIERKLRQDVEKQRNDEYLAELRSRARIEILLTEENTTPPPLDTLPYSPEDSLESPLITPGDEQGMRITPSGSVELLPGNALVSVYFGFDQSVLTARAGKTLDSLAAALKEQGSQELVIVGRTDKSGSSDYNQALGLRRAKQVMARLEKAGIDPQLMEVKTAGSGGPAKQGEAWKDRRVDVMTK